MKSLYHQIFDTNEVNTGRQMEIDIARAILVFCLALIHTTLQCVTIPQLEDVTSIAFVMDSIIGGPMGAPLFMFIMGIGVAYSKNNTSTKNIQRGFHLLILAFVLNICRAGIPYTITYLITKDYDFYIKNLWTHIFSLDILAFAGPAFILIGILQHFKLDEKKMIIISIVMSLISNFFNGIDFHNPVLNVLLGFFIGTENGDVVIYTDFPLLNWFAFPILGLLFGKQLKHMKDKKKFYTLVSPVLFVFSVIFIIIENVFYFGMFSEGDNCFYHMRTYDIFVSIALNIGLFGFYYAISGILPEKFKNLCNLISRNINRVYCIHWVIVNVTINCILRNILGTTIIPAYVYLPIGTIISIVAIFLAHMVENRAIKKKENKSN